MITIMDILMMNLHLSNIHSKQTNLLQIMDMLTLMGDMGIHTEIMVTLTGIMVTFIPMEENNMLIHMVVNGKPQDMGIPMESNLKEKL
jgi:hypothetical protein